MKLIIQIPCFNEEETLPLVFEKMPKKIAGIDTIEYMVINDCSTDRTIQIAKELGVHHILNIKGENKRWLGRAFRLGIQKALSEGADIVVNTDGDNQYSSEDIPKLVAPIIENKADVVIGNRSPEKIREFSVIKRLLQKLGNLAVSSAVRHKVPDAVSGFRAFSKEALYQIHIVTNYTYTVDSLIQIYNKGISVSWIDIKTNPKLRESRLIKNLYSKVFRSGLTILRLTIAQQSFRVFFLLSLIFFIPGFLRISFLIHILFYEIRS